jgi:DNA-binding HxlR family transcriptional regulator
MSEPFGVPEEDLEYRLALRLLNQEPPFDRRVLEDLTGHPKRYSELKPLLGDRNDHVLTKALDRLRDEGVIQQGVDLDRDQRVYHLTELGKTVLFRMYQMVPHEQSIRAYERGRSAEESQA